MSEGFKLEDYVTPRPASRLSAMEAAQTGPELLVRLINGHSKTHFDYTRCKCGSCFSVLENSRGVLENIEVLLGVSIDIQGIEKKSLAAYEAEAARMGLGHGEGSHSGPL
jgi:hypothetical protein